MSKAKGTKVWAVVYKDDNTLAGEVMFKSVARAKQWIISPNTTIRRATLIVDPVKPRKRKRKGAA